MTTIWLRRYANGEVFWDARRPSTIYPLFGYLSRRSEKIISSILSPGLYQITLRRRRPKQGRTLHFIGTCGLDYWTARRREIYLCHDTIKSLIGDVKHFYAVVKRIGR
jgi:hypothetical protein